MPEVPPEPASSNPIVLLHGLFGHLDLPSVLSQLGDRPTLTPDLLGYGSRAADLPPDLTLEDQAALVCDLVASTFDGPAHLVGHSVGGAVAVLATAARPDLVAGLVLVEGNLTPADAFWSGSLARRPASEVETLISGLREAPEQWLADAGVDPTPDRVSIARSWLAHQGATTLQAQAAAVVEATASPTYLGTVRALVEAGTSVSLIAGARSKDAWGVPGWLRSAAAHDRVVADCGHLMMLEDASAFAAALRACCP